MTNANFTLSNKHSDLGGATFDAVPVTKGSVIRRELRSAREPLRLLRRSGSLRRAPTGTTAVMVIPGFGAGDVVMSPLRAYLRSRGYAVTGWGLGTNRGQVDLNLPSVIEQVEQQVADNNQPLALVGWSMGGVFAREVTRHRPELVSQIITMATPIHDKRRLADATDPLQVPITAFYTRRDSVVDWRICIDETNPTVDNIEVDSSHLGITLDPTVWLKTAHQLAD